MPDSFVPDKSDSFVPDNNEPQESFIKRALQWANTPLLPEVEPRKEEQFYHVPILSDIAGTNVSIPSWRDVYRDIIYPMSSPLGVATLGLEGGIGKRYFNAPKEIAAVPTEPPRQIKGYLPLPRGKEGTPPIGFVSGEKGVAENRPYKIDLGEHNTTGGATVLPREAGEVVDVPPAIAATYGTSLGELPRPSSFIADKPQIPDSAIKKYDFVGPKELPRAPDFVAGEKGGAQLIDPSRLSNIPEPEKFKSIKDLAKQFYASEEGSVDSKVLGKVKDQIIKYLSSKEQISISDIYQRVKGKVTYRQFSNIVDKMLASNEIENKYQASKTQAPINDSTNYIRQPTDAVNKLISALQEAGPQRNLQEKLYTEERSKRLGEIRSIKTPGVKGYYQQLGKLKGELPKVDYQGLKLQPYEADQLIDAITNNTKITDWEKLNAKEGLMKILSGSGVPQRSELALLGNVFGKQFTDVVMMHGGALGPVPMRALVETANLMKSLQASIDLSAPLRQGAPLIHTKAWRTAFMKMFPAAISEDYYKSLQDSIEQRPNYMLGRESGLALTTLDDILNREEMFLSKTAEKIPVAGHLMRGSERAYVGFLNKLRADTFDKLISDAQKAGLDVTENGQPNKLAKDLAKYVNTSTGRGDLGRFNKIAPELNALLFSPRMIASRVSMLNPSYYVGLEPFARKQALKSALAMAGLGATVTGLASLNGASIGNNPLSADFGKSKFDNTRIDPYAGFQQYLVNLNRFIQGRTDSKIQSGPMAPTRMSIATNFAANKLSPAAALAYELMTAQTNKGGDMQRYGKTLSVPAEVAKRFIPMFLDDLHDLYQDDPNLFPLGEQHFTPKLAAVPAAAFGMGVQTYAPTKPQSGNKLRIRLQ